MKRSLFMSLVVAALACALALPLYAAPARKAPAGEIAIRVAKAKMPVVKFNHKAHASIACAKCHHHKVGNNAFAACNSKGCHADMASKSGVKSFYAAFHKGPKSCVGCHKAKHAGPTACGKCHKR